MKIKKKPVLFFLLIIPVFLYSPVTSLSKKQTFVTSDSDSLNSSSYSYKELAYIHTDRSIYLTGEFVKFKVYCLEKQSHKPSSLSKVAYVEIYNPDRSTLLQARIKLENGSGSGEIYLPTNTNTDNFIIRGYTRWMRNEGPGSYFHALIPVINPFKYPGFPPVLTSANDSLKFYPEGGSLIDNVPARVVFQNKGKKNNYSGKLLIRDSIPITEFKPYINGMGSFQFIPESGNRYIVEILYDDGTIIHQDLIPIKNNGLSMRIIDNPESFRFQIFLDDPSTLTDSMKVQAVILQNENIIDRRRVVTRRELTGWEINKNRLDDGVFHFKLTNQDGKIVSAVQGFKYSGSSIPENIAFNKEVYAKREMINPELSIPTSKKNRGAADLSISVSAFHDYFPQSYPSLDHYLLLDNTLSGVENIESYFTGSPSEITESINNLLIYENHPAILIGNDSEYIPEYRGPIVTGKIFNKSTNEPAANILGYLSVPGKLNQMYVSSSKPDGKVFFELRDFYGKKEIIAQCNNTEGSIYSINLDNPYSREYLDINIPALNLPEDLKSWLEQQSQNMQITNAYRKFNLDTAINPGIDSLSFYGKPDARYYLDDYTRFTVMEEVFREYISGVYVRKNNEGFHFRINDPVFEVIYEKNPLMLLDGVPVFDTDYIIALDPLDIEKIETIRQAYNQGYLFCHGIVSLFSYNGGLPGYSLPENAQVMEYDGLQLQKKFSFPAYPDVSDKRNRTPDFRNVLFWSPLLEMDENKTDITFYSSDYSGNYEIVINGISENGIPFSAKERFRVR